MSFCLASPTTQAGNETLSPCRLRLHPPEQRSFSLFLLQLALPLAAAARNRNRSQQRALLAHSSSHRGLQAEGVCLALHSPPGQGKPGCQASQPAYRVSSCSPAMPVATPCLLLLGNLAQGQRWCKCPDRSIGAYAAAGQTRTLAPAATPTSARVSRLRLRRRRRLGLWSSSS